MRERLFLPVGGTGGGCVDTPFDTALWQEIIRNVPDASGPVKVGLLTTPSRLSGIVDINTLVSNYKALEDSLGCSFILLDDEGFYSENDRNNFDVLCITCGNTAGARELWAENGCEDRIRQWYRNGVVITGYSAGFIVFYEWASTDSVPGPDGATYGIMPCMGIVKGGAIPHIDTQKNRIPDFQKALENKAISPVIALGENVIAIYRNERLHAVKASSENALAGWVTKDGFEKIPVGTIQSATKPAYFCASEIKNP